MNNIISIILIIASAGLFFGYIDPAYTEVKQLLTEKTQYNRALDNAKQFKQERDKRLLEFNKISEADRAKLQKLLPDNIDNIRFIIEMEDLANKYDLRIRSFTSNAEAKKDTIGKDASTYGTLTFSFSTTASYNVFLAFMKELEHNLRVMDITAISFNSGDAKNLYDYNVTLKTYWLK